MTDARLGRAAVRTLIRPHPTTRAGRVAVRVLRHPNVTALGALAVRVLTAPPAPPYVPDPTINHRAPSQRFLAALGLHDTDGPLFEWQTWDGSAWVTDTAKTRALVGYTARYGRDGKATGRPATLAGTLTYARARGGDTLPTLGQRIRLGLCQPALDALGVSADSGARFTGEVTDVVADARLVSVTWAGRLGRQARKKLPDALGWPPKNVGAAVADTLAAIGAEVGTIEPGGPTMVAPATVREARELLDLYTPGGGDLIEHRSGRVDWQGLDHRRGTAPALTLTAAEVEHALEWAQHVGDIANKVEVANPGVTITVEDPESIDTFGEYRDSIDTLAADEITAFGVGVRVLGRRTLRGWQLPALTIHPARTLTPGNRAAALTLRFGDALTIPTEAAGPMTGTRAYLEGADETADAHTWTLTYAVSDPALTGAPLRWADLPIARTWAGLSHALTWADLATKTDPADI